MIDLKRLITATALAAVFGLTLVTTSSFASGPMMVPTPVAAPKVTVSVHATPIKKQLLSTYRQIRNFWLSRALIR